MKNPSCQIKDAEEPRKKRQQPNQISPASAIEKYAAYALGVADPANSLTDEEWGAIILANNVIIQEKVKNWLKYGNIKAASFFLPGNRLNYFWMVTDNRAVILAPIRKRHKDSVTLPNDVWSIGSFGTIIDEFGADHALTEKEFVALMPNTLVIDDSITTFSFKSHVEAFYQCGYRDVSIDEHEYYCKTLHWVKKLIFDPRLSFVPFSYVYPYRGYEENDIDTIEGHPVSSIYSCDGVRLIRDGLQIESSSSKQLPYYIKDNIIHRKDDDVEVLCLSEKENLRRYRAYYNDVIEKVRARYRNNGLCQYCGGVFLGRFTKKCSKCGRKKNYK